MAKEVTLVLNIDVNKSMNSLLGIKQEMKKIQKAMEEAANAGNSDAYNKLQKRFIDLRDEAEDLNAKLQPLDKQIGIITQTIGGLVSIGTNLAAVFNLDNKNAEALFKTFAKAQAVTNIVTSMNQMVDILPKVSASFNSVGVAMKGAFAANPVGLIITGVVALSAAIAGLINSFDKLDESQKKNIELSTTLITKISQEESELNNLFEQLKKTNPSTEERKNIIEELNKKYPDLINYQILEKSSLDEIAEAQEYANTKLKESIALKLKNEELMNIQKDIYSKLKKNMDEVLNDLDLESEAYAEAAKKLKEMGENYIKWNKDLNDGKITRELFTKNIREQEQAFEDLFGTISRKGEVFDKQIYRPMRKLAEQTDKTKAFFDAFIDKLELSSDKTNKFENSTKNTTSSIKELRAELNLTIFSQTTFERSIKTNKDAIDILNERLKNGIITIEEYRKKITKALDIISATQKLQTIYSSEWGNAWNEALEKAVGKNPKKKAELIEQSWKKLEQAEIDAKLQLQLYNQELAKGDEAAFKYWNTLTTSQQQLVKLGQRLVEVENDKNKSLKESEKIIYELSNKEIKRIEDKDEALWEEWSDLLRNYEMNKKIIEQTEEGEKKNKKLAEQKLQFLENEYDILKKIYMSNEKLSDEEIEKLKTLKIQIDEIKQVIKDDNKTLLEQIFGDEKSIETIFSTTMDAVKSITDAIFDIKQNNIDRELSAEKEKLDKQMEMELKGEEYRYSREEKIRAKYQAIQDEIDKKAAEKKRRLAILQAMINGAQAITSILALSPDILKPIGPLFLAQVGAAVATTAAQIAVINEQKFAKGGILQGPLHANGGILTQFGELEGGEAVINRKATQKFSPILSAINQSTGGNPIGNSSQIIDYKYLASLINDKRVYVVSSDISKQQGIDVKVENRATI